MSILFKVGTFSERLKNMTEQRDTIYIELGWKDENGDYINEPPSLGENEDSTNDASPTDIPSPTSVPPTDAPSPTNPPPPTSAPPPTDNAPPPTGVPPAS